MGHLWRPCPCPLTSGVPYSGLGNGQQLGPLDAAAAGCRSNTCALFRVGVGGSVTEWHAIEGGVGILILGSRARIVVHGGDGGLFRRVE